MPVYVCVSVCARVCAEACVHVCLCLQRPEEGVRTGTGPGDTGHCELPDVGAGV